MSTNFCQCGHNSETHIKGRCMAMACQCNEFRLDLSQPRPSASPAHAVRSEDKPAYSFLPPFALEALAKRFSLGATKYQPHNWLREVSPSDTVEDYARAVKFVRGFIDHGHQHLIEAQKLSTCVGAKSEDTLEENLAAYAWNAMALLEYAMRNPGLVRAALRSL